MDMSTEASFVGVFVAVAVMDFSIFECRFWLDLSKVMIVGGFPISVVVEQSMGVELPEHLII